MLKETQLKAPPATGAMSGAVMLDASHSAYALYPQHRLPISPLEDDEAGLDAEPGPDGTPRGTVHPPLLSLASSLTVRIPSTLDGSTRISFNFDGSASTPSSVSGVSVGGAPDLLWLHMLAVHMPTSSTGDAAPASSTTTSAAATPADAAPSSAPTPASPLVSRQGVEAHDMPEARMRDVTRSYAALEFIGRGRFALDNSLPWPLAVLAAVKPGLKACQ